MDYRIITNLRSKRRAPKKLKRGQVVSETLKKTNKVLNVPLGFGIFIFSFIFLMVKHGLFLNQYVSQNYANHKIFITLPPFIHVTVRTVQILKYSFSYALTWATVLLILYLLFPVFKFFRRIPTRSDLHNFTWAHRVLSVFALSIVCVFWFSNPAPLRAQIWHYGFLVANWDLAGLILFFIVTIFVFIGLSILILCFIPKNATAQKPGLFSHINAFCNRNEFALYLGMSTGLLTQRKHQAGMDKGHPVILSLKDAILNLMVLGGIGSGKTSNLINPMLVQLIDDGYGGLIFDVKGSFKQTVLEIAAETQRPIEWIGPKHRPMNLISGLTPETAAEYVKSAILLDNPSKRQDAHWTESATQLANSVFGLLSFLPNYYTLAGMHRFLYDKTFREARQVELDDLLSDLEERDKRLIAYYREHYETVFTGKYEKYQQSVTGTLDKALACFKHPDLEDAFCAPSQQAPELKDATQGKIYLLDMFLDQWGAGGKTVYMLLKLRFFSMVKERQAQPNWCFSNPEEKPVFFLCDEYQEIIDCSPTSLSDLNFWDKAKDSKCIGIISAQSIKSLYAKIGDRDAADTILQNFRQKICLKTEDRATIEYFEFLTGKVEQGRHGYSVNEGKTKHEVKSSRHDSSSESLNFVDRSVIDAQLVRNLGPHQAMAILTLNGHSMDDVIETEPVFLN